MDTIGTTVWSQDRHCLLEQLARIATKWSKAEFFDLSLSILTLSDDTTEQAETESTISQGRFDACFHIRRLLSTPTPMTAPSIKHKEGVIKLP